MIAPNRFGFRSDPQPKSEVEHGQDGRSEFVMEKATRWAHSAGKRLATTRHWVESEAIGNRPLTTLGVVFGLGVFVGWLVKRR